MIEAIAVKERPILFSGPMVRAILDGKKTQTRRIVKLKPGQSIEHGAVFSATDPFRMVWPYGEPGERLWVRETFCRKSDDGYPVWNADGELDPSCYWFRADGIDVRKVDGDGGTELTKDGREASPWRPSIFMPRHACRIVLEVLETRIERLQMIGNQDAVDEGFEGWFSPASYAGGEIQDPDGQQPWEEFRDLWMEINGKDSWDANPLVWVIHFKRIEQQ